MLNIRAAAAAKPNPSTTGASTGKPSGRPESPLAFATPRPPAEPIADAGADADGDIQEVPRAGVALP